MDNQYCQLEDDIEIHEMKYSFENGKLNIETLPVNIQPKKEITVAELETSERNTECTLYSKKTGDSKHKMYNAEMEDLVEHNEKIQTITNSESPTTFKSGTSAQKNETNQDFALVLTDRSLQVENYPLELKNTVNKINNPNDKEYSIINHSEELHSDVHSEFYNDYLPKGKIESIFQPPTSKEIDRRKLSKSRSLTEIDVVSSETILHESKIKNCAMDCSLDLTLESENPRDKTSTAFISIRELQISLERQNLEKIQLQNKRFQMKKSKPRFKLSRENEQDSHSSIIQNALIISAKLRKRNKKNLGQRHAPRDIALKIVETDEGRFRCGYCSFQQNIRERVRRHFYLRHFRTYICYHCNYQSNCRTTFINHLLKHKSECQVKIYNCDHCSFKTKNKTYISRHKIIHEEDPKTFKCYHCSYQTRHRNGLQSHILTHTKKVIKVHECPTCEYKTKYGKLLQKHSLVHTENYKIKMYKCPQCFYETKNKSHLLRHVVIHSDEAFAKCSQCEFQTRHREYLKRHMLLHKDIDEIEHFECESCDFRTIHKVSLKIHQTLHKTTNEIKWFRCPHCDYKTKMTGSLRVHINSIHEKSKYYLCQICGFKCYRRTDLKGHLAIHNDYAFGKCPHCEFQTRHRQHLKEHLLTHESIEKVKHYKCDFCDFRTKNLSYIKKHLIIRHKTKNESKIFKCMYCNYQTKLNAALKIHINRTHNKLNKYSCYSCDYKCLSKYVLRNHVKIHQRNVKLNSNITFLEIQ